MAEKSTRQGGAVPVRSPGLHHPMMSLRDEVDRLFDSFLPTAFGKSLFEPDQLWAQRPFRTLGDVTPHMDVTECADRYEVSAELPGIEEKDVSVKVQGGMLCISGEKRSERTEAEQEGTVRFSERSYGAFSRTMSLPDDADQDAIAAEYSKGVLKVTIPRQAGRAPDEKTIQIKAH